MAGENENDSEAGSDFSVQFSQFFIIETIYRGIDPVLRGKFQHRAGKERRFGFAAGQYILTHGRRKRSAERAEECHRAVEIILCQSIPSAFDTVTASSMARII